MEDESNTEKKKMERPVPGNPLEVLVSPGACQEDNDNTENTKGRPVSGNPLGRLASQGKEKKWVKSIRTKLPNLRITRRAQNTRERGLLPLM